MEKKQAWASASQTHHLREGRPQVVLFLLNSRDSDPFLTETHECLLGRELPQGSSWASSHSRSRSGSPGTPIQDTQATWRGGGGARGSSSSRTPPSPRPPVLGGTQAPLLQIFPASVQVFLTLYA